MGYSFQFIVVRESMWSLQEDGLSYGMKNLCFEFFWWGEIVVSWEIPSL